jgi:hypothetical protein
MGGAGDITKQVSVNGVDVFVTTNLWIFPSNLRRLRSLKTWYWADRLSTNQWNVDERSQQVEIMGDIYENGDMTIAYLSPRRTDLSFMVDPKKHTTRLVNFRDDWTIVEILFEILTLPYWERLWIVQELRLSSSVLFLYMDQFIQSKDLTDRLSLLELRFSAYLDVDPGGQSLLSVQEKGRRTSEFASKLETVTAASPELIKRFCPADYPRLFTLINGFKPRFMDVDLALQRYGGSLCSDPRDKIFGLQAILQSGSRINVDYTRTLYDILWEALMMVILVRAEHWSIRSVHFANQVTWLEFLESQIGGAHTDSHFA